MVKVVEVVVRARRPTSAMAVVVSRGALWISALQAVVAVELERALTGRQTSVGRAAVEAEATETPRLEPMRQRTRAVVAAAVAPQMRWVRQAGPVDRASSSFNT